MPHLLLALTSFAVMIVTVNKNRIIQLSVGGLVGAIIAIIADSFGKILGLYAYSKMLLPIASTISFFHVIYTFINSILYLNWLPGSWKKRIVYTSCMSFSFFIVEIVMVQVGAITYMNWHLWNSFILINLGLYALCLIVDKMNKAWVFTPRRNSLK